MEKLISQKKRFYSLDSLRGIASLQVVLSHCLVAIPTLGWWVYPESPSLRRYSLDFFLIHSPINFFWAATPAVILFFVLSGFVLSIPYFSNKDKNKTIKYFPFFIKRVIRLYIPCLGIIIISYILAYFLYEPILLNNYGDWIKAVWKMDFSVLHFLKTLALEVNFNFINPALWTLPIEIKLSLLLPVFIFLLRKTNWLFSILLLPIYIVLYHSIISFGIINYLQWFNIFYYFTFFISGAILCKYRFEVIRFVNELSKFSYTIMILVALTLYTYTFTLWFLPPIIIKSIDSIKNYIYILPALFMILIALSDRGKSFFEKQLLIKLGKISFSLYLTHQVVLISAVHIFPVNISPYLTISIGFVLSFIIAVLFFYLVEKPSIKLASYISHKITNH